MMLNLVTIPDILADIQVDCLAGSADKPCDPPGFHSHKVDKGKSI
jgi:hypothetical protein